MTFCFRILVLVTGGKNLISAHETNIFLIFPHLLSRSFLIPLQALPVLTPHFCTHQSRNYFFLLRLPSTNHKNRYTNICYYCCESCLYTYKCSQYWFAINRDYSDPDYFLKTWEFKQYRFPITCHNLFFLIFLLTF